jgi:hypothetical protein
MRRLAVAFVFRYRVILPGWKLLNAGQVRMFDEPSYLKCPQ